MCLLYLFLEKFCMSHLPERKERNCLNCGTIVQGRYCQVCGQENTEPKESFWHMITHFLSDITHFDGKFFSTIKVLFRKPGQLTKEYLAGRRVAYLHPVRMYVFTSAFFFLIFFTFFKLDNSDASVPTINGKIAKDFADEAYKNAKTREDSIIIATSLGFLSIKPGDTAVNSKEDNNDIRIRLMIMLRIMNRSANMILYKKRFRLQKDIICSGEY